MKTLVQADFSRNREPDTGSKASAAAGQCGAVLTNLGFTLVELIVVVAILGCLAAIAIPALSAYRKSAKVSRCMSDIRTIEADITAYTIEANSLPDSLNDVGRGGLRDPWGNAYQYLKIAGVPALGYKDITGVTSLNTDYDVYSMGEDGASTQSLSSGNPACEDDIIRAGDGAFVGLGSE